MASTAGGAASQRKSSAATEPEELSELSGNSAEVVEVDQDAAANSESSEEEYKEGGAQKYITPIEVQDHIKKLWNKELELLGLIYGKFDPKKPFNTDTMGYKQFFRTKVLVPPSRFRPESEGGLGGGSSGGDRAYLHTHSAMLTKVI